MCLYTTLSYFILVLSDCGTHRLVVCLWFSDYHHLFLHQIFWLWYP